MQFWFAVRTRRVRSAGAVLMDAGAVLADLERLLALDDDETVAAEGSSSVSGQSVLSAEGLGELCVGLHRYQELLDTAALSSRGVPKLLRSSSEDAKNVRGLCHLFLVLVFGTS